MENDLLKTLRRSYNQTDLETMKKQINANNKYTIWATGDYFIYLKKETNFNDLNSFFKDYNYDVISEVNDTHIYIKSKNSEDYVGTEYCITGEDYQEYLINFEEDCKEKNLDNNENWIFELENMKKFDSYYMIKANSETEARFIVLLALYILKEKGDVLVYDTFNSTYLNSNRLQALQELIIFEQKNNTLTKKSNNNNIIENIIVITLLLSGLFMIIFGLIQMLVPTIVCLSTFLICCLIIAIIGKTKSKIKKNKYLTTNKNVEQPKREKKIQKSVRDMLTEETYNKLRNIRIEWNSEIIFFEKQNIDAGQSGFRYAGFSDEIIDEWPGNEYVIIGYDPTGGCGPDPYIMKTNEKELPIYWLMTDSGDWKNPDKIANSFEDFIKIINCLNKNLNSDNNPNKELILNEISQINSNENMWYWKNLLEIIIENTD